MPDFAEKMDRNYDSDDSGTDFENLDELQPEEPIKFKLYEHLNATPVREQGELRAFAVKESGSAIYAEKASDYLVSADRLIWVDGYESTDPSGMHSQEMTLVVLKLLLTSADPDKKVKHFTVDLEFKDKKTKGENSPVVEAWAPFRTAERWNESFAQQETTKTVELGAQAGYEGFEVSTRRSRENKISWDQRDFDEGRSTELVDKKTGKRNGVRWFVKQNDITKHGVTQEVWVSVLLSRSSSAEYIVKFRIDMRGGTRHNIGQGAKSIFGLGQGQTSDFSMTPWKRRICNHEGKEIIKAIDTNKLGRLRNPSDPSMGTSLNIAWGPANQISPAENRALNLSTQETSPRQNEGGPKPASAGLTNEAVTLDTTGGGRASSATKTSRQEPASIAANQSLHQPLAPSPAPPAGSAQNSIQPDQNHLPPLMIGWYNPNPSIDLARLASLEGRLAQAEARIAAQDLVIDRLRQASESSKG